MFPTPLHPSPPAQPGPDRPGPDAAKARDWVLFYLNGQRRQVRGGAIFSSLAEYLRDGLRLVGTKLVCTEGDCGACTVLVGRPDGDRLLYQPFTSCILALHQVDGAHVVTVEGLGPAGELTPVQEAMVEHHGSQCGFCTPGMVVALTAVLEGDSHVDADAVKRALTGNLCRCTGYVPILEAALATDRSRLRPLAELYPTLAMIEDLRAVAPVPVRIEEPGGRRVYFSPRRLEDALAFKADHPDAVVIAGGTELGVERNRYDLRPGALLSLKDIPELSRLTGGEVVSVGANVTWARLEGYSLEAMPEFHTIARLFASPQIRNAATLVGNVAFGSPVADSIGYLTVAGAELELASRAGSRRLPIDQFHTGYRQTALRPDEIITRLLVPLPGRGELLRLYKVSKRREMDMTTFRAAIRLSRRDGAVGRAVIAYSGIGPLTRRLPETEAFLEGRPFTEETFREAGEWARREVEPVPDRHGLRDYRLLLARNILVKFYFDCVAGERQEEEVGI